MKAKKMAEDSPALTEDPAAKFTDPSQVAAATLLTPTEKRSFLEQWEQDLVDRQAADGEGMAPARPGAAAQDAALIRFVKNAISSVGLIRGGPGPY